MTPPGPSLALVLRYLDAVQARAADQTLAAFFAPDVVQEEFPNRFVPNGARRDLAGILDAAARGRKVISAERYDVQHAVEAGGHVALEVIWTGTLAVPIASLPAGATMRARFAVFFEVRDGKIVSQRNYDCFDPF